jgi:GTP cyclohydrolase FolE2
VAITGELIAAKQAPAAVNVAGQAIAVQIAGRQDADEGTADIVDLVTQLITTCASDMQAEDVFAMDALAQRGVQSHGPSPPATHNDFDHDTLPELLIAEPII